MITAGDYVLQLAQERGLLEPGQVEAARQGAMDEGEAAVSRAPLHALIAAGLLDAEAIGRVLADEFGVPFVRLTEPEIGRDAIDVLPRSFTTRHLVCPVRRNGDTLLVAVSDPLEADVIDDLPHVAGGPVAICVATSEDIQRTLDRHYGRDGGPMEDLLEGIEPLTTEEDGKNQAAASTAIADATESDAPVIKLVHDIIAEAVRQRASDIHLEPLARRLRVRYRIDGVLAEAESPPVRLQSAIISRLKLMANISIAEKRVPQDGRIQLAVAGRALDLRVSSLPTVHGEGVVMRLLDKEALRTGLADLGLEEGDNEVFHRLISAPDGMMLVTGPTGSGKTTTLYSCLHHLNQADRKIITVEDPVEYQLAGVNQVPVRPETGMTFAAALRAMLRQAPNIVMVGEIRDRETAEISINAALTGHLVFSTLHTNDAPGAVARLLDLGAKPFLLASALRAVVAQRLVRRICPACRENYAPPASELHLAGLPPEAAGTVRFARGTGCPACHGTGYRGRLGIFEIFLMSDAIRRMIYEHASAARLRACAREDGMHTMREDGIRKVLAGHTTINEVVSVTVGDID